MKEEHDIKEEYDIMELLELEQALLDDRPSWFPTNLFLHEPESEFLIEKFIKFIRKKLCRKTENNS